jgi:hypothetical protein
MNKSKVLDWSESFDALRIVPRIVLFTYGVWLAYTVDRLLNWYMALPTAAQTAQASGFCFGAITAVTTIGGYVYRIYANTGREWDNQSSLRTSSVTTEITK